MGTGVFLAGFFGGIVYFSSDFNTPTELSKLIRKRDITFKILNVSKPPLRRAKGILLLSIKGCYTVSANRHNVNSAFKNPFK